jgi:SAM-dependent methyltransferase
MSSYVGWHAELYDLFYADKPYAAEAGFVADRLAEAGVPAGGRLLELACGTGRHALEFEGRGYEVVATDYSPDMLAVARRRKEERRARAEFVQADMRDLEPLASARAAFDAVVSLFDSIGYVETNEAIARVLGGAHRVLRPGGVLALEFWHAAAMLRAYDPVRVRRWRTERGEVVRISETSLDHQRQTATVRYTIMDFAAADGSVRRLEEAQTNRYFLVQEMAGFLERAGFTPLRFCAGFDAHRPIDGDTWHVVAVARSHG